MARRGPCPRCGRDRLLGKWDGTGGFVELCGSCKVRVTLARPGAVERLEATVRAALLPDEDKN